MSLRNELSSRSQRGLDNRVSRIGKQELANALELASLGVQIFGFPDESELPAAVRIYVDTGGGGLVGDVNELAEWVNVEVLGAPRVQRKVDELREAPAAERHLAVLPFVPPDNVTVMYHLGIGSSVLPTVEPECDVCIDGLWLVSGRTATLWLRGRGWDRVVYPGDWIQRGNPLSQF